MVPLDDPTHDAFAIRQRAPYGRSCSIKTPNLLYESTWSVNARVGPASPIELGSPQS